MNSNLVACVQANLVHIDCVNTMYTNLISKLFRCLGRAANRFVHRISKDLEPLVQ